MSARSVSFVQAIAAIPCEHWNALLSPTDNPFVDWRFLAALEQSGCASPQSSWTPCHAVVRQGSSLLAVAPAYLKDGSDGDFSRDWEWAAAAERARIPYYPKLVFGIPFTPVSGRRILFASGLSESDQHEITEQLVSASKQLMQKLGLGALHVLFPTQEQSALCATHGLTERIDFQYHFVNPGYQSPDAFYARFSSKRRNAMRREMAAPAEQGITLETLRYEDLKRDLSLYAQLAHTLHRSTVDKLLWGRRWLNQAFYEQLFLTMPQPLELVIASKDGQVVAGAFNVASSDRLFGRYWGCLQEFPFLHFNVCLYHSIAACIARGTSVFEGGAGGEHKISRGFEPTETYSAHAFAHPQLEAALQSHLQRESERRRAAIAEWRQTESVLKPWSDPKL